MPSEKQHEISGNIGQTFTGGIVCFLSISYIPVDPGIPNRLIKVKCEN